MHILLEANSFQEELWFDRAEVTSERETIELLEGKIQVPKSGWNNNYNELHAGTAGWCQNHNQNQYFFLLVKSLIILIK